MYALTGEFSLLWDIWLNEWSARVCPESTTRRRLNILNVYQNPDSKIHEFSQLVNKIKNCDSPGCKKIKANTLAFKN